MDDAKTTEGMEGVEGGEGANTHRTGSVDSLCDLTVDEDIHHTISGLLKGHAHLHVDQLIQVLGVAVQQERNRWKNKLNATLMEIDRQHKLLLSHQTYLQELATLVSVPRDILNRPELIPEETELSFASTPSIHDLVQHVKSRIRHFQHLAGVTDDNEVKDEGGDTTKYTENDLKVLKNAVAKLHWDLESASQRLREREQEVEFLKGELDTVNNSQRKLQEIVSKYNANHTGANFHLEISNDPARDETEPTNTTPKVTPRLNSEIRVRKYIEGEQLFKYPEGKEEVDFWKRRIRSQVYSNKKGNSRTGVAKCLRCNKLFKPSDNSSKSCRFHSKGREIKEIYDDNGRIVNVTYKWACCRKGIDAIGCAQGYHM